MCQEYSKQSSRSIWKLHFLNIDESKLSTFWIWVSPSYPPHPLLHCTFRASVAWANNRRSTPISSQDYYTKLGLPSNDSTALADYYKQYYETYYTAATPTPFGASAPSQATPSGTPLPPPVCLLIVPYIWNCRASINITEWSTVVLNRVGNTG